MIMLSYLLSHDIFLIVISNYSVSWRHGLAIAQKPPHDNDYYVKRHTPESEPGKFDYSGR